jgi:Flp pilus assembly protein TadD
LKESIRIDPVSPDARLALGSAWIQNGRFEAAVPELERAVQLDPHMNQGYFLLARAYQKLGRKEDAAAAFKKAQQGQE